MPTTTLPAQPTSSPIDVATGEWRAEWKRYLAEIDRIVRRLNGAS